MKELLHIEQLDVEHISVEYDVEGEDEMLQLATCIAQLMYNSERLASMVIGAFSLLLTDENAREILNNSTMVVSNKNFN